jgi:hypothetical protein
MRKCKKAAQKRMARAMSSQSVMIPQGRGRLFSHSGIDGGKGSP